MPQGAFYRLPLGVFPTKTLGYFNALNRESAVRQSRIFVQMYKILYFLANLGYKSGY